MTDTTDLTDEPNIADGSEPPAGGSDIVTVEPADRRTPMPKIGVWSWAFVGFTAAAVIVVIVLGAVSEIALPMLFAAVLAIIFRPLVGVLQRHKLKPTLAAGAVVLGLLLLMAGVIVATVRGVTDQADQIGEVTDEALANAAEQLDVTGSTRPRWRMPGRQPKGPRRRSPTGSSPSSSKASAASSAWSAASSSAP